MADNCDDDDDDVDDHGDNDDGDDANGLPNINNFHSVPPQKRKDFTIINLNSQAVTQHLDSSSHFRSLPPPAQS